MGEIEVTNNTQIEEDDYENFFLQPATSPYNITEKVQEANEALFTEMYENFDRKQKVKFHETNLVTYEPDLTDDDVQSIESYNESIDFSLLDNNHSYMEELKYVLPNKENSMFDIHEEIEEEPDIIEDIIEDIQELANEMSIEPIETIEILSNITKSPKIKPLKKICNKIMNYEINCKNHCIEKFESTLDLNISKLNLNEKPNCPTLKLQRRNCCENKDIKTPQILPQYTGCRSEYGLSSSQIERREKRKEIIKLKEQKQQIIQEEYRKRKIQQNEVIFCQWLKDISNRKLETEKCNKWSIYNINRNKTEKIRPKTADSIINKPCVNKKPKRPYTSNASVFIEIPQSVLKKGIRVGDLLVNYNRKTTKQLHVLGFFQ